MASALDAIPGLGPERKAALLRHFGSVRKIKAADLDSLQEVSGIGPALAVSIRDALAGTSPGEQIDTATGEIVND